MQTRKYVVYENDLKYKSMKNIDPSKAEWFDENVKNKFYNDDLETLKYRFEESKKNDFFYLDLSHLKLKEFNINLLKKCEYFENLCNIKFLCLNNNELTKINNELELFTKLEIIDISYNKLHEFNYSSSKLKELLCHDNELHKLPKYNDLLRLDCTNNNLIELPEYSKLEEIICDNNKITNLPTYSKVKRIICRNNPITHINIMPNLTYLDCSLTLLSGKLSDMNKLTHLVCNNTKISDISNLINIKTLEIANTKISKIPHINTLKDLLFKNNQQILLSSKFTIDDIITEHNNTYIRFKN